MSIRIYSILFSATLVLLSAQPASAGLLEFLFPAPQQPQQEEPRYSPPQQEAGEPMDIGKIRKKASKKKKPVTAPIPEDSTALDRGVLNGLLEESSEGFSATVPAKKDVAPKKPRKALAAKREKRDLGQERAEANALLETMTIKLGYIHECKAAKDYASCKKDSDSKECKKTLQTVHTLESTDGIGTPKWQHVTNLVRTQTIAKRMPIFSEDAELKRELELSIKKTTQQRNLIIAAKNGKTSYCDYTNGNPPESLGADPKVSAPPKLTANH